MDYNRLLGICIPTYNRSNLLKDTLLGFIDQVKYFRYPIFVSDDASADDTEALVKDLMKVYPYIYYRKNKKNLGSGNFIKVIEMADTKYIWLFGDDDLIYEKSIEHITDYLVADNIDYIVLNSTLFNSEMTTKVKEKNINIENDRFT